jgi:hypothetical protein
MSPDIPMSASRGDPTGRARRRRLCVAGALGLVLLAGTFLSGVRDSDALPAFARKYNADCAMCHFPVVPRLNNFGQQFRRAGYRTKIEFDQDQDMTKVNELVSGRLRAQVAYDNTQGTVERSEFRFPEASLYYVGPVSRSFSAYIHVLATNSSNVDVHGHVMWMYGGPDSYLMVRAGQMHMLQQEGVAGFDRATGININPVHTLALTATSSLPGGVAQSYNFDLRQKGLELAYIRGPGRLMFQVSNGLNQTGSGTANIGDIDPQKDYLVAYEHLLDDLASGFTAFYYNGTTHGTALPLGTTGAPTSVSSQFNYSRYGVNLSKVVPVSDWGFFELQGGYVRSHDNNPASVGRDVSGNSFYVESQQYLTGTELIFYERFSMIDLDESRAHSTRKDYTGGFVKPLQSWVRLSGEYTYTDNRFTGITGHVALLELQINF